MVQATSNIRIAMIAKYENYHEGLRKNKNYKNVIVHHFQNLEDLEDQKIDNIYDYVFFPHYSKRIPDYFIEKHKCIGFHTGNLPDDRGGSPIQNKILRREYQTKVSAFLITSEVDQGPIYCQRDIDLEFGNLYDIICTMSNLISEMIFEILGSAIIPVPQPLTGSTHNRLLESSSAINFKNIEIKAIYDKIRMVDGFDYPRAFMDQEDYIITFSNASLLNDIVKCEIQIKKRK